METNTVIISVQRYDDLRVCEEFAKHPKKYCIIGNQPGALYIRTTSETVKHLESECNRFLEEVNKRSIELNEARERINYLKEQLRNEQRKNRKHGWFRRK
jgi:FtsZ-binding cell division protein ZapB